MASRQVFSPNTAAALYRNLTGFPFHPGRRDRRPGTCWKVWFYLGKRVSVNVCHSCDENGLSLTGMMTSPGIWSPPKGETTFQMRNRVLKWYSELPQDGLFVAITHGGPTAALRGSFLNLPVEKWIELIPACGITTCLEENETLQS